ncbi:MAG TPA: hypothetical protein VGG33_05460 [Polyangia bacterium]
MMAPRLLGATLLWAALGAAPAFAQTEPKPAPAKPESKPEPASDARDADIFGAPAAETAQPPPAKIPPEGAPPASAPAEAPTPQASDPAGTTEAPAPAAREATGDSARDTDLLGDPTGATRFSEEAAPEDPLRIGGMFYQRALSSARESETPDEWTFSAPTLTDVYLDARPNERVRGLVLGRMFFDSTLPSDGFAAMNGTMAAGDATSDTMGTAELSSLFARRTRGPTAVLDQMWLRFDLARTVFVTAGKQHVRWGTARFWTPSDFLHVRRRNPLDVFDARTGTTMLKLHLPWESLGWNFYAYGLMESPDATSRLADLSGAARAEIVLGSTELGVGALVRNDTKPKIALDLSTGIWEFDLYGELAIRHGSEIDRVRYTDLTAIAPGSMEPLTTLVERFFPAVPGTGWKAQAVAGLNYARKYNDNDVWNLGAEYFYNPLGYSSPQAYPGLILPRAAPLRDPATFFYLGRHYGAVFLSLPAPYRWDYTTFTLSTLGNLSDRSFISRLDYSLTLLTHLRFEAFVAVRYGKQEGEFRFGVDDLMIGGQTFNIPPSLLDLGLALRVNF